MQEDIANLLCKDCIAAATFEQTTQDAIRHSSFDKIWITEKPTDLCPVGFSLFSLYYELKHPN